MSFGVLGWLWPRERRRRLERVAAVAQLRILLPDHVHARIVEAASQPEGVFDSMDREVAVDELLRGLDASVLERVETAYGHLIHR